MVEASDANPRGEALAVMAAVVPAAFTAGIMCIVQGPQTGAQVQVVVPQDVAQQQDKRLM
jgi:hypothetical protein